MTLEEVLDLDVQHRPNALHPDDRVPYVRTQKDYILAYEIVILFEKYKFDSYTL